MILPAPDGTMPTIDPTAFIAKTAVIIGHVEIGPQTNIWYGAVLRGDYGKIKVGARTSIQENAVVHVEVGTDVTIGDDNIIGHGAIVHGPGTIGNKNIIGLGSIVMQGHDVGDGCIIGAGALARGEIPNNSLAVGVPAKIVKQTTEQQVNSTVVSAKGYVDNGQRYKANGLGEEL